MSLAGIIGSVQCASSSPSAGRVRDEHQTIMRKEEQREERHSRDIKEHRELEISDSALVMKAAVVQQRETGVDKDFCNKSYFVGQAEPDGCAAITDGEHITTPAECRWAAEKMHKHAGNHNVGEFEVKDQWYIHTYPEGCFQSDQDDTTFWYNTEGEVGDGSTSTAVGTSQAPAGTSGKPICHRPKYAFGDIDTNGGCHGDMAPVLNEFDCRTFEGCLGQHISPDESFRVGIPGFVPPMQGQTEDPDQDHPDTRPTPEWGNPNKWPQGCFVRKFSDNSVNFNANMSVTPDDPQGTPACSRPWVTVPTSQDSNR